MGKMYGQPAENLRKHEINWLLPTPQKIGMSRMLDKEAQVYTTSDPLLNGYHCPIMV